MIADRWIVFGVSLLVAGLLWTGSVSSADEYREREERQAAARLKRIGGMDHEAGNAGNEIRLPPGITVDPNTGLMVGFDLEVEDGMIGVPWETLRAYEYTPGLGDMPEEIKKLDGKKVAMLGFLWAIYDFDDIRRFGLVGSHWSCCYGIPPGLGDMVAVTLEDGHRGLSQTLNPVRVQGTLRIRERKEGGFTVSIYDLVDAKAVVLEY